MSRYLIQPFVASERMHCFLNLNTVTDFCFLIVLSPYNAVNYDLPVGATCVNLGICLNRYVSACLENLGICTQS